MKKYKFPKSHPEAQESELLKSFRKKIEMGVERGESLEQLSERIGEDTVPNFYGAQFRAAYNEGIEQGSAYGFEQPLDLHDAIIQQLYFINQFPQNISCDFNKEPETVEAEFEVVESKTGATFICEVQAIGGKRCVVQCDTCRNNEGQLVGGIKKISLPVWDEKEQVWKYQIERIPGVIPADDATKPEDFISTPFGDMSMNRWYEMNVATDWGYEIRHGNPEDFKKLLMGSWKPEPTPEVKKDLTEKKIQFPQPKKI